MRVRDDQIVAFKAGKREDLEETVLPLLQAFREHQPFEVTDVGAGSLELPDDSSRNH